MTEVTLPVVIVKKPFSVVLSSKFSFKALPSEVMHFMWIPSIPDIKQVRSSFQPKRKKKNFSEEKHVFFFFSSLYLSFAMGVLGYNGPHWRFLIGWNKKRQRAMTWNSSHDNTG